MDYWLLCARGRVKGSGLYFFHPQLTVSSSWHIERETHVMIYDVFGRFRVYYCAGSVQGFVLSRQVPCETPSSKKKRLHRETTPGVLYCDVLLLRRNILMFS